MRINGIKSKKTFTGVERELIEGDLAVKLIKIITDNPYTSEGSVRISSNALCGDELLPAEFNLIDFNIGKYAGETFNNIPYEEGIVFIKKVCEQAYTDAVADSQALPEEME